MEIFWGKSWFLLHARENCNIYIFIRWDVFWVDYDICWFDVGARHTHIISRQIECFSTNFLVFFLLQIVSNVRPLLYHYYYHRRAVFLEEVLIEISIPYQYPFTYSFWAMGNNGQQWSTMVNNGQQCDNGGICNHKDYKPKGTHQNNVFFRALTKLPTHPPTPLRIMHTKAT